MATEEVESLFSLELAVNSLCIVPHTVNCRMPAVAFRLLDFPSLIVQQLDETETKHLKEVIQKTWSDAIDLPNQLRELKDRHGNYEFNKAKSLLFKYKLNSFASHLQNTPLYVMVVDMWTIVPKLIAHCNISLSGVISSIRRDVSDLGLSVPSVHGMQGKFTVFNLMGSEIGWVSLGIRLLSLGGNLIPHIPNASLTKRDPAAYLSEAVPIVESELSVQKQSVPMWTPVPDPATIRQKRQNNKPTESKLTQSVVDLEDTACQTMQNKENVSDAKNVRTLAPQGFRDFTLKQDGGESDQELYITNTHMPAPLFYTSEKEESAKQKRSVAPSYAFQDKCILNERNMCDANQFESRSYGSKELEVQYTIHPPEYHSSPNVRKILRSKKKARPDQTDLDAQGTLADESTREKTETKSSTRRDEESAAIREMSQHHRLPILRALLQELSLLSGGRFDTNGPPSHLRDDIFQQTSNSDDRQRRKKDDESRKTKSQTHEHRDVPVVTSVKPPVHKPYRHKHKNCAKPPSGVPPSKGWVRQEPVYDKKQKQTKLKFKMTNSQKLRIQKHNPEAFRLLEEEERLAEIEFQMRVAAQMQEEGSKSARSKGARSRNRSTEDLKYRPEANVSTEISRHDDDGNEFKRGLETFKIPTEEPDEWEAIYPTPVSPDTQKISPDMTADMPDKDDQSSHQNSVHKDTSGSEKSVLSINVHMPSTLVQDSKYDHDHDEDDDESSNESQEEEPKVLAVPGFLDYQTETIETPEPVAPSPGFGYSDDFDGSYKFESTGEQELASFQTSKASGMFSAESSMNKRHGGSVEESESDHSEASSYRTAESVKSVESHHRVGERPQRAVAQSKSSSSSTSSRHPASVLSIPQPQMSANSPIPLARRSSLKSVGFNPYHPPQPKPRLSLDQSAISSISNASLLAPDLTLSNSRDTPLEKNAELMHDYSKDYHEENDDAYSDDFDSDDN